MKKFVYQVAGFEWVDTEAFGNGWKQAKEKATELHAAVYRLVVNGDKTRQEFFADGGCFLPVCYQDHVKTRIF